MGRCVRTGCEPCATIPIVHAVQTPLLRPVAWLLTVGLTLAQAPVAGAQAGAPEATADSTSKRLKSTYDQASAAFQAGKYEEAGRLFDQGFAQSGLPAFQFNAAVAWEKAGNLERAIERYSGYLLGAPKAADAQEIQDRVAALRQAVANQQEAQLQEMRTKGVAIITSKPEGAEIRLDDPNGPLFAQTPFRGTLPPGEHTIHIRAEGYKPESKVLPDNREKMLIAHFSLSEAYFLGHLEVRSNVAGAKVYLERLRDADGNPVEPDPDAAKTAVGRTPFSNQIPPGTYRVRVAKDGYTDWEGEVEVAQGKVRTAKVELQVVDEVLLRLSAKTPESKGAEVRIDRDADPVCVLPCETRLSPGNHKVEVSKKRMKPLRFEVAGNAADLVEVAVDLKPATKRTPAIVTGVLTLGTAATGIAFGIMARRTQSAIQSDLDSGKQLDASDPRAKIGKRNAIIADAMFGATAILGALALYYLLRKKGPPSTGDKVQRNLTLAPGFSTTGVGLVGKVQF